MGMDGVGIGLNRGRLLRAVRLAPTKATTPASPLRQRSCRGYRRSRCDRSCWPRCRKPNRRRSQSATWRSITALDDTELELQKARAQAEVASLRSQRDASKAELQLWRHHRKTAEHDLDRYRELEKSGAATTQRLEEAENAAKEAAGRVEALEAQVASFEARTTAAQRGLDLVALKIQKSQVVAPINATVLVKAAEVGEFLQPGSTIAVLVDLSQITLRIFLPEASQSIREARIAH